MIKRLIGTVTAVELLIVAAIIGILVAVVVGFFDSRNCHDDVMSDCMRDGKQAYECKAIANSACYQRSFGHNDWND